jgi:hypothetical protein
VDNKAGKPSVFNDRSSPKESEERKSRGGERMSEATNASKRQLEEDSRFIGYSGLDFVKLRKSKIYADFAASTAQLKHIDRSEMKQV